MTEAGVIEARGAAREAVQAVRSAERYEVLDSWRGISALMVVLFHFPAENYLSDTAFMTSGFLFVDFFFVLSGFVIASAYATRLKSGKEVRQFIITRFGRLYPLHFFMLSVFVAFELVRLVMPQLAGNGEPPFTGSNSIPSLVANFFMVHGLGFENALTWNSPSWSISTEFFAYLFFVFTIAVIGTGGWLLFLSMAIVGPVILYAFSPNLMDATYDFGLVRCLYGFSLGALLSGFQGRKIRERRIALMADEKRDRQFVAWTLIEGAMIAAIAMFVTLYGSSAAGIGAPFVFVIAIYIFAHEGGWFSRLLLKGPFLWLGMISYSVYMVHIFVQGRMINVATLMDRMTGTGLVGEIRMHGFSQLGLAPGNPALGIVLTLPMVAGVLASAWLTWRFVEMPALAWFRRQAKRIP